MKIRERIEDWKENWKDKLLIKLVGHRGWEDPGTRRVDFLADRVKHITTWDGSALWALDSYLAELIHSMLEEFRRYPYSLPPGLTQHEWEYKLYQMSKSFYYYAYLRDSHIILNKEEIEELNDGLHTFADYFGDLWL